MQLPFCAFPGHQVHTLKHPLRQVEKGWFFVFFFFKRIKRLKFFASLARGKHGIGLYVWSGSINSHYFHIIGDGKLNPIVGVYTPIITIPIKGEMTIPNIGSLDPGTYRWLFFESFFTFLPQTFCCWNTPILTIDHFFSFTGEEKPPTSMSGFLKDLQWYTTHIPWFSLNMPWLTTNSLWFAIHYYDLPRFFLSFCWGWVFFLNARLFPWPSSLKLVLVKHRELGQFEVFRETSQWILWDIYIYILYNIYRII